LYEYSFKTTDLLLSLGGFELAIRASLTLDLTNPKTKHELSWMIPTWRESNLKVAVVSTFGRVPTLAASKRHLTLTVTQVTIKSGSPLAELQPR
jgi:hypothetical protein